VFGDGWITATIPDDAREVSPGIALPLPAAEDLGSEIRRALTHPTGRSGTGSCR
jgi:hypothetical protein